ncbi:MAG: purine-nucleoside phosphorylase [Desulfonatronovibrionaceae bacterium]
MSEKIKVLEGMNFLQGKFPDFKPDAAVVMGSGLGKMVQRLNPFAGIDYTEIPAFPASTVPGHRGTLYLAELNGLKLAVLSGRAHLYEGYSARDVVRPLRVLRLLGAGSVLLTNAAGALNPLFDQGQLMCITDHINLTGENPLAGENIDEWGPRFPDMSRVYSLELIRLARSSALELKMPLQSGVYAAIKGPSLETPAETRFFRMAGADAIGMSTALEAIAARHMNMKTAGISCLTNKNLPDCMQETSLEEILAAAEKTNSMLMDLILEMFSSPEPWR